MTKEDYVRGIFNTIAPRYDLLNTLLSFNCDRGWRRFTVARTGLGPGDQALDVCCGTGMLSLELARKVAPGGRVVGLDFSPAMLQVARQRLADSHYDRSVELVEGNALELPFADNTFDCATIAFGLRNLPDVKRGLAEMQRVVRPGGRVVSLELAKPSWPFFKQVYYFYFDYLVPLLGRLGIGRDGPYSYLPRSLKGYPHQEEILQYFKDLGLVEARYYELTGGIVAVHVGIKAG
ncbi:bifunctional demethylmenaquinone methyltransferase/2-methoxy-6-polyprenyl-1,4-benzoquinol methylase UbiE [Moorella sp. Hama-1]|uniref:bifunctional demethylmenaquinone methyltransferase/2-methoxy-6-polyprenyl-1,4-benzoquinol methylase UbiE n=1 Tax=Moorella sp. Hama-1 TaxID=2138101 RepID=UPI000D64B840|nr:bifunctional demethylmenaquinone methyltransferase/2-methoxy-6-polyprenyl-1,4-benzoquinol methylase UbiE [Moorella sp. Hama-1]BCV21428.1 demethylmenaquinone methyltransferase [Moorella sp. Hama-1]